MHCDDVNKLFMVWFIHSILFAVFCVLHLPVLLLQGLKNLLLKVSCNLVPSFVLARHLLFTTDVAQSANILQGSECEADKMVFLGWPGQNEPEEEALNASLSPNAGARRVGLQGALSKDNLPNLGLACGCGQMNAQLSQETADKMSNRPTGAKQLT